MRWFPESSPMVFVREAIRPANMRMHLTTPRQRGVAAVRWPPAALQVMRGRYADVARAARHDIAGDRRAHR